MACINPRNLHLLLLVLMLFLMGMSIASAFGAPRPAVLITGSTDGIGVTTAKHMAAQGFAVLMHGRNEARLDRAQQAVEKFVYQRSSSSKSSSSLVMKKQPCIYRLPATDLSTVAGSTLTAQHTIVLLNDKSNNLRLDIVMNNAGVYSETRVITPDGTEQTFAVNVVAPFVITSLLLPHLLVSAGDKRAREKRIVTASSISQCSYIRDWEDMTYEKRPFSAHGSYSESKLLDAMLTIEMSKRLQDAGLAPDTITCNCLDPGTVNTKMLLAGWGNIGINVEDALDQTWLCTSDDVNGLTGKYFVNQHQRPAARSAYDPSEREKLWDMLSNLAPEAAAVWNFDWRP